MNAEGVTLGAGVVRIAEVPAARPFPLVCWASLLVLLLAEVLALTLRFDTVALLTGILVGACAWGFGWLTAHLWQPLGHLTLWVVQGLLRLLCPEVICRADEMVVGTPSFLVQIAPSCLGYEGIGLVWAFVGA